MQAKFVALALSYSLGNGKLALKGRRKQPWLEVSRSEVNRSYSNHQLKRLRELHDGPIDFYKDRIPTNGYYDLERFRLTGEGLWRAYELLCPRDKPIISRQVLDLVGVEGLTALWLDKGRFVGRQGHLSGRWSPEEYESIASWIREMGVDACVRHNQSGPIYISMRVKIMDDFIALISSYTHQSMKKKLKPVKV